MAFAAIPGVPQSGLNDWQFQFLNAMKQNVEELTGQSPNSTFRAITAGALSVATVDDYLAKEGLNEVSSVVVSGTSLPTLNDMVTVATVLQQLIVDVNALRDTLNTLIIQLQRA